MDNIKYPNYSGFIDFKATRDGRDTYFMSSWHDKTNQVILKPYRDRFHSQITLIVRPTDSYGSIIPIIQDTSDDFIKVVKSLGIKRPNNFANGSELVFNQRISETDFKYIAINNTTIRHVSSWPGETTFALPTSLNINSKYEISLDDASLLIMENGDEEIEIEEAFFRVLDYDDNSKELRYALTHQYAYSSLKLGLINDIQDTLWQSAPFYSGFEMEETYGRVARLDSEIPSGDYTVILSTWDEVYFLKPANFNQITIQ